MSSTEEQKEQAIRDGIAHIMKLAEEANGKPLTQKPNLLVPLRKKPKRKTEEK